MLQKHQFRSARHNFLTVVVLYWPYGSNLNSTKFEPILQTFQLIFFGGVSNFYSTVGNDVKFDYGIRGSSIGSAFKYMLM